MLQRFHSSKSAMHTKPLYPAGLAHVALHTHNQQHAVVVGEGGIPILLDPLNGDIHKELETEQEVMNAVTFGTSHQTFFAVYDVDRVGEFTLNTGELKRDIIRLPCTVKALDMSENMLLALGDDGDIRVVLVDDLETLQTYSPQSAVVKSICLDPRREFFAAVGCDGSTTIWKIGHAESPIKTMKVMSTTLPDSELMLRCDWNPSGHFLAMPTFETISIIRRGSWEYLTTLKNGHNSEVSLVRWSSDGVFLASVDDKLINIWNVGTKRIVSSFEVSSTSNPISSLVWNQNNSLIIFTLWSGELGIWDDPIPESERKANEPEKVNDEKTVNEINQEEQNEDEPGVKRTRDIDDESSNDDGDEIRKKRKLTKVKDESKEEDEVDKVDDLNQVYSEDDMEYDLDNDGDLFEDVFENLDQEQTFQPTVQPGACPEVNRRRMLGWNLFGSVESQNMQAYNVISIQFSDKSFHKPIRFNDHYNFQIAAIGPRGVFLASKFSNAEEKPQSVICFKPFNNWATKSDWTLPLPPKEEAVCVAVGNKWVAVATNTNFVRLLSLSGRQIGLFCMPGPIVSICGHKDMLGVVSLQSPTSSAMVYKICNVCSHSAISDGVLCLSPKSRLTWMGFSENDILMITDSMGVTRGLFNMWGFSWIPIMLSAKHQKSNEDYFFTIGVTAENIMSARCVAGTYPQISPMPVLYSLSWQVPLIASNAETARIENDILIESMLLLETAPKQNLKTITRKQAALDKKTMKLIRNALKDGHQFRALDLCTELRLSKALSIASKLADHHRMPILMEKINLLQKNKVLKERQAQRQNSKTEIAVRTFNESTVKSKVPQAHQLEISHGNGGEPLKLDETIPVPKPEVVRAVQQPKPGSFADRLLKKRTNESQSSNSDDILNSLTG